MSRSARIPVLWPAMSDTNRAVQPQKMARGWKFQIKIDSRRILLSEYLCSICVVKNKGADQLDVIAEGS